MVPTSHPSSRLRFAQVRTPSPHGGGGNQGHTDRWSLSQRRAPPPEQKADPPPPLGRCRHTPGQRDAGRLLPCALPRESVSGNFSRRHVLGATTTKTTTYHTIPYHTIPYSGVPPGESEVRPQRGPRARGRRRVFSATPDEAPTGDPPPKGGGSQQPPPPPPPRPPPPPPQKMDSGAEGWGYSPMPRGHELTWPYSGRHTPAPPPHSRGIPIVPRAGSTPPPPQGAAALGGPRPAPEGLSGFAPEPARPSHAPPSPAAALGPARSPPRRPTHYRDPGLGAPVLSPARPPESLRQGPSQSGSAARGRSGALPASTRIHPR